MGKIRAIFWDLDGVLIDSKDLHFESLNIALASVDEKYVISKAEHDTKYDGLPTKVKLNMLHEQKGLPLDRFDHVQAQKQEIFLKSVLSNLVPNAKLLEMMHKLRSMDIEMRCCSNAVYSTVWTILEKLQLRHFFAAIYGNDKSSSSSSFSSSSSKIRPKPHPCMYLLATLDSGCLPHEIMICEDSRVGRQSAIESGCYVCPIQDASSCSLNHILKYIKYFENQPDRLYNLPYIESNMNVVIPMAGLGSRFVNAGYKDLKPMIIVHDQKTMIQVVCDNLNLSQANHIVIAQQEHVERYKLDKWLPIAINKPNVQLISINGLTAGAACTVLKSKHLINSDTPLFIANSDQYIEWDMHDFFHKANKCDGGILTFYATEAHWSYVSLDQDGFITRAVEKQVISDHATVGIYYWKRGSDFVKFAEEMCLRDSMLVNNEFYVVPVYNLAIAAGLKFISYDVQKMHGLGTPEDLQLFQSICN